MPNSGPACGHAGQVRQGCARAQKRWSLRKNAPAGHAVGTGFAEKKACFEKTNNGAFERPLRGLRPFLAAWLLKWESPRKAGHIAVLKSESKEND